MFPPQVLGLLRRGTADQRLRAFACACCRRVGAKYPPGWAEEVFRDIGFRSGGYVGPDDWNDRPWAAVRAAESFARGQSSARELLEAHAEAARWASEAAGKFSWADHRLGDSASGEEFDVGFVASSLADAARDASNPLIVKSAGSSIRAAAAAFGGPGDGDRGRPGAKAESRFQELLFREMFPDSAEEWALYLSPHGY